MKKLKLTTAIRGFRMNKITGLALVVALALGGVVASDVAANASGSPQVTSTLSAATAASGAKVDLTTTIPTPSDANVTTQEVVQSIDPNRVRLTGPSDVVAPTGWTVTYSTDGITFASTPVDWASVVKVKATGPALNAQNQVEHTAAIAQQMTLSSGSSSTGDGWNAAFDDRGLVVNAFHNAGYSGSEMGVDCHYKSTGASCGAGWPFRTSGLGGSYEPNQIVDSANHHIWMHVNNATQAGFLCIDTTVISTPVYCGGSQATAFKIFSTGSGYPSFGQTAALSAVNGMLFSYDISGKLACYDYKANSGMGASCRAFTADLSALSSATKSFYCATESVTNGSRFYMYYHHTSSCSGNSAPGSIAVCIETTTMGNCPGWTSGARLLTHAAGMIYNLPDESGRLVATCFKNSWSTPTVSGTCVKADGTWFNQPAYMTSAPVSSFSSPAATSGSKVLWGGKSLSIYCYDAATGASCPSYPATFDDHYSVTVDSDNPNCMWVNSHDNGIKSVDVVSGRLGCSTPSPRVKFRAEDILPRMACEAGKGIRSWTRFDLSGLAGGSDYQSATLTVLDAAGEAVTSAGRKWENIPMTIAGGVASVDLSALTVADSGAKPTFQVDFAGRVSLTPASGTIVAVTDPAQLCLSLKTVVDCPEGILVQNPAGSSTTMSAEATSISAGSVRSTLTGASVQLAINAPALSQCGASLSGTAYDGVITAGVANVTVTLIDGSSNDPLVGVGGSLISTTTDAFGAYSFGTVMPGTYKVKFADLPASGGDVIATNGTVNAVAMTATTATSNLQVSSALSSSAFTSAPAGVVKANAVYTMAAATGVNDVFPVGFNTATTLPVTANDLLAANASWNYTTLKLCNSQLVCATTPIQVSDSGTGAIQGTYSISNPGLNTAAVVFTPATGFTGTAQTVSYRISDTFGTPRIITPTVTAIVAPAPVLANDVISGAYGGALNVNPLANDAVAPATTFDVASLRLCSAGAVSPVSCANTAGTPISVIANSSVVGSYTLNADGTVSFAPAAVTGGYFTGTAPAIYYSVADNLGVVRTATITATVTPVAPVITTVTLPGTGTGQAYSSPLAATPGSGTIASSGTIWTISPSTPLPAGLTLNAATGVISGIATAAGTFPLDVTVTDALGQVDHKTIPITVTALTGPTITTTTPRAGVQTAVPMAPLNLAATAGTGLLLPSNAWSMTTSPLTTGLTLDATTGVITGTPSVAGGTNITFTVTVTDVNGLTNTKEIVLPVYAPPVVTSPNLPKGYVGAAISPFSNTATRGTGTIPTSVSGTWTATNLPPGLSIDSQTGVISGTPTQWGSFSTLVTVTDSNGLTSNKTITQAVVAPPQILTVSPLRTIKVNVSDPGLVQTIVKGKSETGADVTSGFSVQIVAATAPPAGYTAGIPTGMRNNVNATGYVFDLTPTAVGKFAIDVIVSDANFSGANAVRKMELIEVVAAASTPPVIDVVPTVPTLTAGAAMSSATVHGTTYNSRQIANSAPTWTAVGLPAGLTLAAATGGSGMVGTATISGTPTTAGTYQVLLQLKDSGNLYATNSLTITVAAPITGPTVTTPADLGTINTGASIPGSGFAQTKVMGTSTVVSSWSATGLPVGMSINSSTGVITGTAPITAGDVTFTLTLTDGNSLTSSKQLTLHVVNPPVGPTVTTGNPPTLTVGSAMTSWPEVFARGTAVIPATGAWTSTALPAGLYMNPNTGAIMGTPTASGTTSVTVTVTDAGGMTASQAISIVVNAPPAVTTPSPLPIAVVNSPIATKVETWTPGTAGTAGAVWSASGLPAGLAINPATGEILGTPTASGSYDFTVTVTDSAGLSASKVLSITVCAPPVITTPWDSKTVPTGQPVSQFTNSADRGSAVIAEMRSWTATNLPPGLVVNTNTGEIIGVPTTPGVYSNVVMTVTDTAGLSATKTLSITVINGPKITSPANMPNAKKNVAIASFANTADIGSGALLPTGAWALANGTQLPAGLTLNANTGAINGTPSVPGTYTFRMKVTDVNNLSDEKNITILVNDVFGPSVTPSTNSYNIGGAITPLTLVGAKGDANLLTTSSKWALAPGSNPLPAGLSLDSTNGTISGSPTGPGLAQTVTLRLTDVSGLYADGVWTFNIYGPPTITTSPTVIPGVTLGSPIVAFPNTVSPGTAAIPVIGAWSVLGSIPGGLSINPNTGEITGTPTAEGQQSFVIQVTDVRGLTDTETISIFVGRRPVITTAPTTIPRAVTGTRIPLFANTANKGTADIGTTAAWSLAPGSNPLPAGLVINPDTGAITGTPTAPGADFTFTVRVTDVAGLFDDETLHITIVAPPLITTTPTVVPTAMATLVMPTFRQTRTQGTALLGTNAWSLTSGALPAGVSIDPATGELTGTPQAKGTYAFTLKLTDDAGLFDTESFTWEVIDLTNLTTIVLPNTLAPSVVFTTNVFDVSTTGHSNLYPDNQVTYTAGPASACTVNASGSELRLVNPGACTVTASSGAGRLLSTAKQVFGIRKMPTTIALQVDLVNGPVFTAGPFSVVDKGHSGMNLPLTYTAGPATVCSVSADGTNLRLIAPGDCSVTAASGTGLLLSKATQTFPVRKLTQTLTVATGVEQVGSSPLTHTTTMTDDPAGLKLDSSLSPVVPDANFALLPVYSVIPVRNQNGTDKAANCDVDDSGLVTWTYDLTLAVGATGYEATGNTCRILVTHPGTDQYNAVPDQWIDITATHSSAPPTTDESGALVGPAVSATMPRTNTPSGGTNIKYPGGALTMVINDSLISMKPWTLGSYIGLITADITVTYDDDGDPTTQQVTENVCGTKFGQYANLKRTVTTPPISDPTKNTAAGKAAELNAVKAAFDLASFWKKYKYNTMKEGNGYKKGTYMFYKKFTDSIVCKLNTKQFTAFKAGKAFKITALVTRDRRWPGNYSKWTPRNQFLYSTKVPWKLNFSS